MLSKRFLTLILAVLLLTGVFVTSASAKGKDDAVLSATVKNSKQYIGIAKSSFCTEYIAANGDNDKFYRYSNADINSDAVTDITDLVKQRNLINQRIGVDFNFDAVVDSSDLEVVRMVIIGYSDFEIE